MDRPTETFALVQKHDGYSGKAEGPHIESRDIYLDAQTIPLRELSDGQVLIKMAMASINPPDIHYIKGEYGHPRVKGAAAGFEGVGEVIDGNGDYAQSLIGKRVAFTVDQAGSGAWSEYAITSAQVCIPVRDDMRNEDAAAHVVNPLTAMAMFDLVQKAETSSFIMTAANSQLCKLMTALGRDHDIAPICIVRKSDGGYNYTTTDLATVKSRIEEFDPERIIYVTDERQQLHFRQFFSIAEKMGLDADLVHVWFGLMRLPEATFSTREGNVIKLEALLDEAEARALEMVKEGLD